MKWSAYSVSLALHAVIFGVAILAPALLSQELPPIEVETGIVVPITLPPPPQGGTNPAEPSRSRTRSGPRGGRRLIPPVVEPTTLPVQEPVAPGEPRNGDGPEGFCLECSEGPTGDGAWGGSATGTPGPPPPPKPVRADVDVRRPVKLRDAIPIYPELARRIRLRGFVVIECTIDPQGRVADARVLKGHPLLDEAALTAVRQWIYTPTLLRGVPVPVVMTVTVRFELRKE